MVDTPQQTREALLTQCIAIAQSYVEREEDHAAGIENIAVKNAHSHGAYIAKAIRDEIRVLLLASGKVDG